MRFKTESLIFFFAFEDYYFKRLGFEPYVLDLMDKVSMISSGMESSSRATLDDLQTTFANSDAIEYQIVGNSKAMEVFAIKGVHGEQQSWQFNPLQYTDLLRSNIPSITMQLCTPTGDPFPFLGGDSLYRLHFRRKLQ